MLFTRTSRMTGIEHSMEIDLNPNDYEAWFSNGVLIQVALPYLTSDEREFLMTGITAEEWENMNET